MMHIHSGGTAAVANAVILGTATVTATALATSESLAATEEVYASFVAFVGWLPACPTATVEVSAVAAIHASEDMAS